MIELRWLKSVSESGRKEVRLQYREGEYEYGAGMGWIGTDWRDVPTVSDDAA